MDDTDVIGQIHRLVEQEHELRGRHPEGLAEADQAALATIEEQLDQCWDLLRQRRAKRSQGLDPDGAAVRSVDTVEHYRQ